MDVPNVQRAEYSLLDVDEGFLSLMLPDGSTKDDVKLPEGELGDKIKAEFGEGKELMVTILTAMGEEACVSYSGFLVCRSLPAMTGDELLLTIGALSLCICFARHRVPLSCRGSPQISVISIVSFWYWPLTSAKNNNLDEEEGNGCSAGYRQFNCVICRFPVIEDRQFPALSYFFFVKLVSSSSELSCCDHST